MKMVGGKVYLKEGVVPHIFECQGRQKTENQNRKVAARKRKILEILQDKENISENSAQLTVSPEDEIVGTSQSESPVKDIGIQVLIPRRSVALQTSIIPRKADVGCNTDNAPQQNNSPSSAAASLSSDEDQDC
ncbi:uncharacterized protein LOC123498925 [Portunus trituberculatus]|uniref:uncharacterized protein LOC123498925 n=1 Tax=Portunus trituberculatus TaxID=210409 RepID=UPI001E1D18BB|nr:uncharacterized protein LOC123498925 [Portunus trituberculatus]